MSAEPGHHVAAEVSRERNQKGADLKRHCSGSFGADIAAAWAGRGGQSVSDVQGLTCSVYFKPAPSRLEVLDVCRSAGSPELFTHSEAVCITICYPAVCLSPLYLSSPNTYARSSAAWHSVSLNFALNQPQTHTQGSGLCFSPSSLPHLPCKENTAPQRLPPRAGPRATAGAHAAGRTAPANKQGHT